MVLVELINNLQSLKGWTVLPKVQAEFSLSKDIKQRYLNFPQDWITFISNFKQVSNSNDTIWFLCTDDYNTQDENAFRWNEWELISIQAAKDDNDMDWQKNISKFWDNHIPIVLSVENEYSYYAIRLADGVIVHGYEPEFEEYSVAANSFTQFVEKILSEEIVL